MLVRVDNLDSEWSVKFFILLLELVRYWGSGNYVNENPYIEKRYRDLYQSLISAGVSFPETDNYLDFFHIPETSEEGKIEEKVRENHDESNKKEDYERLRSKLNNLENLRVKIVQLIAEDGYRVCPYRTSNGTPSTRP